MPEKQVEFLFRYMEGVIAGKPGGRLVKENHILETEFTPEDVITLFDRLFDAGYSVEELKSPSNKLFNLLHQTLDRYSAGEVEQDSFLSYLIEDNRRLEEFLKQARPLILKLNSSYTHEDIRTLTELFESIQKVHKHYVIKENALFPILERYWPEHQCLKLMWSYHDDIRETINETLRILAEPKLKVERFNSITGELYFSIFTILYREEKVLIPRIVETIDNEILKDLLPESGELGFSYLGKEELELPAETRESPRKGKGFISLNTGKLSLNQLEMLFTHMPMDITYVDENDEVLFYSDPPHRIFPRSKSIIGRKVQNCHPPESLHIVEKILTAFRSGEKDKADFVIRMGPKYIQIRYFAVRDEKGDFKGTLEVSQDISDIRTVEEEHRLLDWD